MLSTRTFNRIVKSESARVHERHFGQNDRCFNGIEMLANSYSIESSKVQLERVQESNRNWHNVVYVQN